MFSKNFDRRIYLFLAVFAGSAAVGLPFGFYALWPANVETDYEPIQPIDFSHALHAGTGRTLEGKTQLQIDCIYCHSQVETGPKATVPSVSTCMNCHSEVQPKMMVIKGSAAHGQEEHSAEATEEHASGTIEEQSDESLEEHATETTGESAEEHATEMVEQLKPGIAILLQHYENNEPIEWIKVHDLADFVYFDHSRHNTAGLDCTECHGDIQRMRRVRRVYSLKMAWCLECHQQGPTETTSEDLRAQGLRGPINCSACHR